LARKLLTKKSFWAVLIFGSLIMVRLWQEIKNIENEPVSAWKGVVQADCAVVLTGGAGRVREGFDLLANQNIKKLIISGVHQDVELRDIMPTWTFYGPLKEEDVVLEKRSATTYGNAQQSLAIVEALRCRDVILVTSRIHMYRSYQTFRTIFPPNIPIYKQAVVSGRYNPGLWEVLNESFKSLFYSSWVY
jgi:uncharacterized SAM-binding protein YcdF (DUF218 family)